MKKNCTVINANHYFLVWQQQHEVQNMEIEYSIEHTEEEEVASQNVDGSTLYAEHSEEEVATDNLETPENLHVPSLDTGHISVEQNVENYVTDAGSYQEWISSESKVIKRIFMELGINGAKANRLLKILKSPGFDISKLAPSWYYLERIEDILISKQVILKNF